MQQPQHTKAILCQPPPHERHFGCQTLAFPPTAHTLLKSNHIIIERMKLYIEIFEAPP